MLENLNFKPYWGRITTYPLFFSNHKSNNMRDTICRIVAQSEENYGDSHHPHWKKKGGVEFTLMVDADAYMYNKEILLETIKELLEREESNNCIRFTYISHELVFRSYKMDDDVFEEALRKNYHKFLEEKVWDDIYGE